MELVIGLTLIALGCVGIVMHVRSSLDKGPFVGTRTEIEFVAGTFMALMFLPLGIVITFLS